MLNLILFFAVAAVAYLRNWQAQDLIWNLWSASLVVGFATMAVALYRDTQKNTRLPPEYRIAVFIMLLVLFGLHFLGFHLGQGFFLQVFYPLIPWSKNLPWSSQLFSWLWILVQKTWLFVLVTFLSYRDVFLRQDVKVTAMTPYINVAKMHLLIVGLLPFKFFGLENRWIYFVVLLIYFLPITKGWTALKRID